MSSVVEPVDFNNTAAAAAAAAARAVLVTAQPVVSIAARARIIATTGSAASRNQVAVGGAAANGELLPSVREEESCCTCMKTIVWVAMVFFFLEFILSILLLGLIGHSSVSTTAVSARWKMITRTLTFGCNTAYVQQPQNKNCNSSTMAFYDKQPLVLLTNAHFCSWEFSTNQGTRLLHVARR